MRPNDKIIKHPIEYNNIYPIYIEQIIELGLIYIYTVIQYYLAVLPIFPSSLDPIPIKLLNGIAPHIISNIAHIINKSLTSGTVSLIFKHSLINPIIKKPSLDPSFFNKY